MINLVRLALRQRLTIVGFFIAMIVAGGVAFYNLNIEAYPDPVPPMVEIVTQASGLSAEEMERGVTIPIEVQMSGLPHMTAIRAISLLRRHALAASMPVYSSFQPCGTNAPKRNGWVTRRPSGRCP